MRDTQVILKRVMTLVIETGTATGFSFITVYIRYFLI